MTPERLQQLAEARKQKRLKLAKRVIEESGLSVNGDHQHTAPALLPDMKRPKVQETTNRVKELILEPRPPPAPRPQPIPMSFKPARFGQTFASKPAPVSAVRANATVRPHVATLESTSDSESEDDEQPQTSQRAPKRWDQVPKKELKGKITEYIDTLKSWYKSIRGDDDTGDSDSDDDDNKRERRKRPNKGSGAAGSTGIVGVVKDTARDFVGIGLKLALASGAAYLSSKIAGPRSDRLAPPAPAPISGAVSGGGGGFALNYPFGGIGRGNPSDGRSFTL